MKSVIKAYFILIFLFAWANVNGCVVDSVSITPASCLNISDASFTIHASGGPGMTYSIDGGVNFSASPVFTNVAAGTYFVVVNSTLPCSVNDTIVVGASTVLISSFTANPNSLSIGEIVTFTNTSIGETSFEFQFGDGNSVLNTSVVAHSYLSSGVQNAMLIASNANCVDTAFLSILVITNSSLFIPNVFSPNGDDVNDLWMPQAVGMEKMEAVIYNRFGEIVHTWLGPKGYWDGFTFPSGVACSEGTYFYWIKATGFDGVIHDEKGFITLLK